MQEINKLINSLILVSYNNLPVENDWINYELKILALRKYVQINACYTKDDGTKISFDPEYQDQVSQEDDLTFLALDLRKMMYQSSPEQGAWYTCELIVYPNNQFNISFNYEDQPNFAYQPSKEKFLDDLQFFPRSEIPEWINKLQE